MVKKEVRPSQDVLDEERANAVRILRGVKEGKLPTFHLEIAWRSVCKVADGRGLDTLAIWKGCVEESRMEAVTG